jgi:hypothetical protein
LAIATTANSPTTGSSVRYAKEHNLKLDFTTPPKRPDPKGLTERILKILDEADAPK